MEQFYNNLDILREKINPEIIDVLAQPGVKEELKTIGWINKILIYDKGFFNVKDVDNELWNKIKGNYDAFVILYNNPDWKGYHQINEIAKLSKSRYLIGIYKDQRMFIVPYGRWWTKRLSKTIKRFILIFLRPTISIAIILFLIIFIPIFLLVKGIMKIGLKIKGS